MPLLMRIARLPPARDNGVGGQPAGLEDGNVNDGAQFLRGQRRAVVSQLPVPPHLGCFQGLDALGQPHFRHHQRRADFFDFVGPLEFALRENTAFFDPDFDFVIAQFAGQAVAGNWPAQKSCAASFRASAG